MNDNLNDNFMLKITFFQKKSIKPPKLFSNDDISDSTPADKPL